MNSFRDLEAWKKGMLLVKETYRLSSLLPDSEKFGLISQMRRSSTSILANLAEGFSRTTAADKAYKYTIARGECSETLAIIYICIELQFFSSDEAVKALVLCEEVGKIFTGLIRAKKLTLPPNSTSTP